MIARVPQLARKLLDGYQRGFPLVERPFAAIGEVLGVEEGAVIAAIEHLLIEGIVGRVGAVVEPGRAGASTLAALAAPPTEIEAIARAVSAFPEVNHNYERDHRLNLWFVVTAPDSARVAEVLDEIRRLTGLDVLDLPMVEAYHLDLGFKIRWPTDRADDAESGDSGAAAGSEPRSEGRPSPAASGKPKATPAPMPLNPALPVSAAGPSLRDVDRRVLSALQDGLPPEPRPYRAIARRAGISEFRAQETIGELIGRGVIRRLGLIVRHRALGYRHNAMAVFDVPDHLVADRGRLVAASGLATLCYRRERRMPQWPFNLYLMVHARSHAEALGTIGQLRDRCGLDFPGEILFGTRCFKQQAAQYFPGARPLPAPSAGAPGARWAGDEEPGWRHRRSPAAPGGRS